MIRNVVIIYSGDDWYKDVPFSKKESETKLSFEDWYERAAQYDIKFYRASVDWFDREKSVFVKAWTFENGEWLKVLTTVAAHAIYDKTAGKYDYSSFEEKMSIFTKVPILNHPLFRTITNNKLGQHMLFGEYMPNTLLANNKKELLHVFDQINGLQIVIKPLHGSGGSGIFIGAKKDAINESLAYPVIVQEFIVSTMGIPGFSKKDEVADLRLIYIDHKLVYALSRIAAKGSLFTNFHQGATVALVPNHKIPQNVTLMAQKIIQILSVFAHANYSLDFIFNNEGKPILVEMNTAPGFDLLHIVGTEKVKRRNFKLFVESINGILS